MWIGGNGAGGDICVFASGETQTRDHAKATVHINGEAGDIVLRNADCAEEFDTSMPLAAPGTVMVIADDESLATSQQAYDRRVAGVVSGAGRYRPAIVLDRRSEPGERLRSRSSAKCIARSMLMPGRSRSVTCSRRQRRPATP